MSSLIDILSGDFGDDRRALKVIAAGLIYIVAGAVVLATIGLLGVGFGMVMTTLSGILGSWLGEGAPDSESAMEAGTDVILLALFILLTFFSVGLIVIHLTIAKMRNSQ